MAKTKPSKKIREFLWLSLGHLKNACACCLRSAKKRFLIFIKILKKTCIFLLISFVALFFFFFVITIIYTYVTGDNKVRETFLWYLGFFISIFLAMLPVVFWEEWDFFIGDVSFKRIYRNSEGHIIPLLGGVLVLAVFYSINAWLYIPATENGENREITLWPLGIFTGILLVVWVIIYQIKKANLRNDIAKNFTKIFMKHLAPYPHVEILQLTNKWRGSQGTEIKGMEIENRNFYVIINIDLKVENLIKKYLACKNLDFVFNEKEIDSDINFKVKENIRIFILEKLGEISEKDREKIAGYLPLPFEIIVGLNKDGYFCFIKEGNPENPKNFIPFKVDIEENKPPFVILETLKSTEEEQKFLDINAQQISYVEYQEDRVNLTITQPNASPRNITVSLSEWLANRDDLR